MFGGTLAAAHNGLGDFLELGQQSTYVTHRQTYARFVMGLIDRWVESVEPRDEKELQVDPSLYAQYEKELAASETYNMPEPPEYPGSTMAYTKSGVFAGNGDDDENGKEEHSPADALTDHGMYARRPQATSNDDMTDQERKRRK